MVDGGKTDVRVDLLKPADGSTTDEPEYYSRCVAHIKQLSVENDALARREISHNCEFPTDFALQLWHCLLPPNAGNLQVFPLDAVRKNFRFLLGAA